MQSVSCNRRRATLTMISAAIAILPLSPIVAQPPNDLCPSAITVAAGTVSGSTVGAVQDAGAICVSRPAPDVWYRVVATQSGVLTVSNCSAGDYDSVLAIWTACPSDGGGQLACNDDACGVQSTASAPVTIGQDYYIRVSGWDGATGSFTLTISENGGGPGGSTGPDVYYSDISEITQYGPVGDTYAFALGTATCNLGDENLLWGNAWGNTPSVGFNAYRIHDGRMLQIGQSWSKIARGASAGSGCGIPCNGVGGTLLGSGCRDVYSAAFNGMVQNLARRSGIDAYTGEHAVVTGSGDPIFARLQVPAADLNSASFPSAQYFVEGVYVGADDALAGNALNNASHRRATLSGPLSLNLAGSTVAGQAAIYEWAASGGEAGVPDPLVLTQELDIPDEGRFIVADKVRDLGNGWWRYDYAVFNLNSDRAGGSLSIPLPAGAAVANVGFHDVDYHSGEIYDVTDWTVTLGDGQVRWAGPQTFAQNPNANALRWGTMYNFWFDSSRPPVKGEAVLGLFKPHTPQQVAFSARVPSAPSAPGDLDGDGHVTLTDLSILLSDFGCMTAPCAGDADGDGDTDLSDLSILLAHFGI